MAFSDSQVDQKVSKYVCTRDFRTANLSCMLALLSAVLPCCLVTEARCGADERHNSGFRSHCVVVPKVCCSKEDCVEAFRHACIF